MLFLIVDTVTVCIVSVQCVLYRQTVELVQAAEQAGVEWITVHGRTTQQRIEPVNFEAIKLVCYIWNLGVNIVICVVHDR